MIWIESVQEPELQSNPFEKWNSMDHIIDILHRVQFENHLDRSDEIFCGTVTRNRRS